jgi:hypothetical protein
MPAGWNWVALRDVPYHGRPFSYFLVREAEGVRVHATSSIECNGPLEIYAADVSDDVRIFTSDAVGVALRRDGDVVLLVGNTGADTIYAPIQFTDENLLPERAACRVYNSERHVWEDRGVLKRTELRALAFSIERGGFRLLEIHPADE